MRRRVEAIQKQIGNCRDAIADGKGYRGNRRYPSEARIWITSLQLIGAGPGRPWWTGSRPALFLTCKAETRGGVPSRLRATDWFAGFATHLEHVCGVARCTR